MFWFDAFTVVDVLTVLPYYVELVFLARGRNVPQFLRVLQLIRIVRIMKVGSFACRGCGCWMRVYLFPKPGQCLSELARYLRRSPKAPLASLPR